MTTSHAWRSMRRHLRILCALATAAACGQLVGCSAGSGIDTEADLARHIAAMVAPGMDAQAARAALTEHDFTCVDDQRGHVTCRRKLAGVVCNQIHFVFLPASGPVPGDLKTQLDSVCL